MPTTPARMNYRMGQGQRPATPYGPQQQPQTAPRPMVGGGQGRGPAMHGPGGGGYRGPTVGARGLPGRPPVGHPLPGAANAPSGGPHPAPQPGLAGYQSQAAGYGPGGGAANSIYGMAGYGSPGANGTQYQQSGYSPASGLQTPPGWGTTWGPKSWVQSNQTTPGDVTGYGAVITPPAPPPLPPGLSPGGSSSSNSGQPGLNIPASNITTSLSAPQTGTLAPAPQPGAPGSSALNSGANAQLALQMAMHRIAAGQGGTIYGGGYGPGTPQNPGTIATPTGTSTQGLTSDGAAPNPNGLLQAQRTGGTASAPAPGGVGTSVQGLGFLDIAGAPSDDEKQLLTQAGYKPATGGAWTDPSGNLVAPDDLVNVYEQLLQQRATQASLPQNQPGWANSLNNPQNPNSPQNPEYYWRQAMGLADQTQVPTLNQADVDKQMQTAAAARAQQMGQALRAMAIQGANAGASPESEMGQQGQLEAQGANQAAQQNAGIQMQADYANMQQQSQAWQDKIKFYEMAAASATNAQDQQRAASFANQARIQQANLQQQMMQYEWNLQNTLTPASVAGDLFGLAGHVGGALAGGAFAGPGGAAVGAGLTGDGLLPMTGRSWEPPGGWYGAAQAAYPTPTWAAGGYQG
jgi:hypothetical protein